MKVPLIVTLLFSVVAEVPLVDAEPINLNAVSGGGIIVKCSYEHKYRGNEKFFCKGDEKTCKFNRISKNIDKRFLLHDTNENHFLVLMTKLTTKDSGIYQCVVKQEEDIYKNSTFSLKVKEDPCCGRSTTNIGYVGGDADIRCIYPNNTSGNIKYFYKQHETTIFSSSALPEDKNKHIIVEDRPKREFRVTLRKLTLADAGVYWCGVGTGGNTGSISLTAEVRIRVNDPTDQTSPKLSTPSSRVTLESTELTLQSSGDRTLLIASLSVVVLVAGVAGVFLYVCKGRKAQAEKCGRKDEHHRKPQADCVYDEIKDSSTPETADRSTAESVYALAQSPSDPSQSPTDPSTSRTDPPACPNYATVTFHKKPDGATDASTDTPLTTEYATIQHPK